MVMVKPIRIAIHDRGLLMRIGSFLLPIWGLILSGRQAWADAAEDRAAADTLFQEARTLGQQNDFAQACPKFAASQKLDPRPGRLLALGDCYERKGDTASAWSTFREATSAARAIHDEPREKEAIRRTEQIEPHLSKLLVSVPKNARTEGLDVRRNGNIVVEALWGSAFPVDPGSQIIEVTAPGKKRWSRIIDVSAKPGTIAVEVPVLPAAAMPPESKKSLPLIVIGGASGLAGIGTGIGLWAKSSETLNEALKLRDGMPDTVCNPAHARHAEYGNDCRKLADTLIRTDTLINAGASVFVVGLAFATGTMLYVLIPRSQKNSASFWIAPVLAPGSSGFSVQGHF